MNVKGNNFLPTFCEKRTVILGCGNSLFGDDGFGPAVVEYLLSHYDIPEDIYVMDAGTGARKVLFTLSLSSERPEKIVIIDAVDKGKTPGEFFELPLDDIPAEKTDDFSLHQVPSSNLAKELSAAGVDVHVIACQISHVPESVQPGLSEVVIRAVPRASQWIVQRYFSK